MHIHLIAVGKRLDTWVQQGYDEYAKRLPRECSLRLIEIEPGRRSKAGDVARAKAEEEQAMLAAIPARAQVIALDERGKLWNTVQLSQKLDGWLHGGADVALLVGGADGLTDACRARAQDVWSLSHLTLPHGLVRIVLAEQLYRAWSILHNHPYHRA
ncbi:MAG: 23S rRNA (pseudouridine(1915)-N(3))-methyltransferase RlmH [Gammaproteobacteria bacterium]|nr:23S rRNA (pseudouridine(1915)-N(3))-methyltransferase RlmH [Gammaproteobacteria bacterium]